MSRQGGLDRKLWLKTKEMSSGRVAELRLSMLLIKGLLILILSLGLPLPCFSAHPLITDDTGTQGEGSFQLEVNGEFSRNHDSKTTEELFQLGTIISFGIKDPLDLVLAIPYQHLRTKDKGFKDTQAGISDLSLELKWRFLEEDGWSFALKPGVTLPTGDEEKGLGSGRASPTFFFIMTKELKPWSFYVNLGYIRNENRLGERTDLWHASLACEWEVIEGFKLVANVGSERNPERTSTIPPAFILGGLIYSLTDSLDLDVGLKGGLTNTESDYSILAGLAWRF